MIMEGRLDPVIEAVTTYYQTEKLKQVAGGENGLPHSKSRATAGDKTP
jgi:hypothetical protein